MSCFNTLVGGSAPLAKETESCIVHVQKHLDSKPTSLSHFHISRKLQEKEMDSLSTVLEREINSSKSNWRGAVLRHSQCSSSCPVPELEAVLVVTGNERHKCLGWALCPVQQLHIECPMHSSTAHP